MHRAQAAAVALIATFNPARRVRAFSRQNITHLIKISLASCGYKMHNTYIATHKPEKIMNATTKPIKITTSNASAIEARLKAVNGRAFDHAYTDLYEIEALALAAEKALEGLGLPKNQRAGAIWAETSGAKVSNAYSKAGFSRAATFVRLERRSSGWYLVAITKTSVGQEGGGKGCLTLTKAQADEAHRRFAQAFYVAV